MTIIKNKKYTVNLFFTGMIGVLIVGGTFAIREYNTLVDARHAVRTAAHDIASTNEENTELRNTLYGKTDPVALEKIAQAESMVLETRPAYLSVKKHSTVSRR
mgnify:FL=1